MEFTYENQGTNTYLVYQIGPKDEVDTMSLGMLTNNKILGLIPAIFVQMDENRYIKYNVSAKVSVKQFFSGVVNKKRLTGVFSGIVNAMISSEEYMISPNNILLDLDYIYTDVSTCETNLICLPVVSEEKPIELGMLFKNIVFSTQFDQTENCDYVAKIISYLNSSPVFYLEDFKKVLDEINDTAAAQPIQRPQTQTRTENTSGQALPNQPVSVQPVSSQSFAAQPAQNQFFSGQPVQARPVPASPVQPAQQVQSVSAVQQPVLGNQPAVPQGMSGGNGRQAGSASSAGEKQISMMTLLTHYNKENMELYKKQKAQKKNTVKEKKPSSKKKAAAPAFEIPGQPTVQPGPMLQAPSAAAPQPVVQTGPAMQPSAQAGPMAVPQQTLQSQTMTQQPMMQAVSQPQQVSGTMPANFGETTVLNAGGNIGETTVLSAMSTQAEVRPMLFRKKTNEKIVIDKAVFRIGKEKSYVDYFIGDNTAVSRSHANILTRDNEYFIIDTNSTNHTYVNGTMIQSNVETKLTHGTKIQLANEEFEFRMY